MLFLLDAVPGGTGYLKTLYQQKDQYGRDAEGIMEVLRLAKMHSRHARVAAFTHSTSSPDTDGCYRCIRTYHMQYSAESISRERGIELLTKLIKAGEQRLPQKELAAIKANSLFESMLEKKFVEALKSFVNKSMVHGKTPSSREARAFDLPYPDQSTTGNCSCNRNWVPFMASALLASPISCCVVTIVRLSGRDLHGWF